MQQTFPFRMVDTAISLVITSALVCGMAGCGSPRSTVVTPAPPSSGSIYAGTALQGVARAGNQPIIGAAIQLYAAGLTGNGSKATVLLATPLISGANGQFRVPAGYPCPSASSQVYAVVRGGAVGNTSAPANNAIALLAILGACNQIVASSQITVNEVTTVAGVYALSQFFSVGGNIGASSTNIIGLQNAATTASALADTSNGTTPGPAFAANGTSPAPRINSLANLLHGCVVSIAGATACSALFAETTSPGAANPPTNTLDAAFNLVRNPAANVPAIYALSAANPAFLPALTKPPSDWTLFVNYTGGGMNGPTGLGIDSSGDIWVANYFNTASLFSPLGKPVFPQGLTGFGLSASYGLAVDAKNNAWIPNEPAPTLPGNSVTVLTGSGQSLAGTGGFTAGGLDYPVAVAIDTDASAWVVDYGNSHLTHLSSSGQPLSGPAGYTSPTLAFPVAAAIDASHNVWVANQGAATVTKVAPDGSQFTSYTCCNAPSGLAVDQLANVWVTNFYGNSVSEISASGTVLSNGAYTGGGLHQPQGIAIDGAGDVWIANYRGPSITELAGARTFTPGEALSPPGGLGADAALLEAYAVAIDASGNLWVTNFGISTLTQYVGLAAPVRTPMAGVLVTP